MMLIDEDTGMRTPAPRHLWLIGGLSLLWNSFGALDYILTQTQNQDYLAQLTPEQLELYTGMPFWATAAWAVAIWASVAGSLLLLFRSRFAAHAFLLSLAGMALSFFHNIVLANGAAVMGAVGLLFTGAIIIIAVGLYLYARRMARREILA